MREDRLNENGAQKQPIFLKILCSFQRFQRHDQLKVIPDFGSSTYTIGKEMGKGVKPQEKQVTLKDTHPLTKSKIF